MSYTKVHSHTRNGYSVKGYVRSKRPKAKRRIILAKPVKYYPIVDKYGRRLGLSNKPPKKR